MVMLDTMLPALYTNLVKPGRLSWTELIRACCLKPVEIANPEEQDEDAPRPAPLLLFDPQVSNTVTEETLTCGTLNTPFLGQKLDGAVTLPLR